MFIFIIICSIFVKTCFWFDSHEGTYEAKEQLQWCSYRTGTWHATGMSRYAHGYLPWVVLPRSVRWSSGCVIEQQPMQLGPARYSEVLLLSWFLHAPHCWLHLACCRVHCVAVSSLIYVHYWYTSVISSVVSSGHIDHSTAYCASHVNSYFDAHVRHKYLWLFIL